MNNAFRQPIRRMLHCQLTNQQWALESWQFSVACFLQFRLEAWMETWHKRCVSSTVTKPAIKTNGYFQPQSSFTSISFQDVCPELGSSISWRAEIIIICIDWGAQAAHCRMVTNHKTVMTVADQYCAGIMSECDPRNWNCHPGAATLSLWESCLTNEEQSIEAGGQWEGPMLSRH